MTEEPTERRAYPRCPTQNGLAAEINNGSESLLGLVMNISREGLAFRCLNPEERIKETREPFTLATISSAEEIVLLDIPCKIALDQLPISEYSMNSIPMRRCRIQFDKMNPGQESQVEYLIGKYAKE